MNDEPIDDDMVSIEELREKELAADVEIDGTPLKKKKSVWWRPMKYSTAAEPQPAWMSDRRLLPKTPPTRSGRPWEPKR